MIEGDIEALKAKVESLEKLVNLKDAEIALKDREIETKKREICELRVSFNNFRFVQLDGHDLDLETTDTENDEDTEESLCRQELYKCEACAFETPSISSRKHKHKCEECGKTFISRENLERHRIAKIILKNSDPLNSPDANKKLSLIDFEVVITNPLCPVALLYFEAHRVLEHSDVPHFAVELVVLGDLSESGCYVDWAALSMALDKHKQKQ